MANISTINNTQTNKLLVVGHPLSNLQNVLEVMHQCNISQANKLQKEGIEADEISRILLKAHGITEQKELPSQQISVNGVWNGLAMDLMMSNLDQEKWVWADSAALPLLNYWKTLDQSLSFVLVYNSPKKLLASFIENMQSNSKEELEESLKKWHSYNRTLVNFYYRNQDRSILVNSEQVQNNSSKYLQEVGKQIGLKNEEIPVTLEAEVYEDTQEESKVSLYDFFIDRIIDENEYVKQLYMELESVANLPSTKQELGTSYVLEQLFFSYMDEQLQQKQEKEELNKQLTQKSENTETLKEENELQLTQLMSVQEELEKIYLEKNDKVEKIEQLQKELETQKSEKANIQKELETQKSEKANIQKEKEELNKQLTQKSENTETLKEENELQLTQLMSVQEELEKVYLENIELKKKPIKPKTRHYGAAERVKKQLSYRLGAKMIENSKTFTGFLGLPFTLYSEVKKYREEKKTTEQKKLPPIYTYADAYEAECVKKHLSYRLGQAMIKSMESPFGVFKIPFALKVAYSEYKEERK